MVLQLEGLQADIMSQLIGENAEAFSAQRLRNHISHRLQVRPFLGF